MPATRSGASSKAQQQALSDMPGVTASRKTGGGKRANQVPTQERPLKRTEGGGRSGKKAEAAAEARRSTGQHQRPQQDTAADDSRAIAAAVDTGESPQQKLEQDTKQTGLKAATAHGQLGQQAGSKAPGTGKGPDRSDDAKGDSGGQAGGKEMQLDKSDHVDAAPAGAKRGGPASGKAAETRAAKEEAREHPGKVVKINRAPVLTLWVKKVAERQGYDEEAALTFGKAISGMLAQSKGRRLGIFEEKVSLSDVFDEKEKPQQAPGQPQVDQVEVAGIDVKISRDGETVRALEAGDKAMDPQKVRGYLKRAFGEDLADAEAALGDLAAAYGKDEIGGNAYRLYENFRPTVSDSRQGWGAKADLDLGLLCALAHQHQHK